MPLVHTIDERLLTNGAKGIIVHVPGATVMSYTIHFRAGNDYAKRPDIQQVAHIMEHMSFGPNARFDTAEAFSQSFSLNGAYSNATTWDTNMHYYADCALMEWDRILDLQLLAVGQPHFLPATLEAEKGNVRDELVGYLHDNPRLMWQKVDAAMGSLSLPDADKLKTLAAVTIDDIKEHHARTHTTANMRFVLAGNFTDVSREAALKLLEAMPLKRGERLLPKPKQLHDAPLVSVVRHDQKNVNFGLTICLPRQLSIDEQVSMSALNHILTGTFHSRIWGKARQAGICYSMESETTVGLDGYSSWDFYGQVRPETLEPLFELILTELQAVLSGSLTDQELSEAQSFKRGDYQMRGQMVGSLADWYGGDYFFNDTIDPIDEAPRRIETITHATTMNLAREFIETGVVGFGAIGSVDESVERVYRKLWRELFRREAL